MFGQDSLERRFGNVGGAIPVTPNEQEWRYLRAKYFYRYSFLPLGLVSLSTLRYSTLLPVPVHNGPAACQDHCGRCRFRTRDLCPRSLVRY